MTRSGRTADIDILRRYSWLAEQERDFADTILAAGRLRHYEPRDSLHHEGDPPGGIYGVVTGGIGVYGLRPDGMLVLAHIQRPGQWLGEHPMLGSRQRTLALVAIESSDVLCVPLAMLRAIGQSRPEWALALGRLGQLGALQSNRLITELLMPRAEQRIAAVLLRATAVLERAPADLPESFLMCQSDIGEMANVSRNMVNRILARFAQFGWIDVGYSRIHILAPLALRAFLEGAEDPLC
jgi:CRP-like cAMP-binding protein